MVVRYSHVTEVKQGNVYRAEYTVHCGWIDWSHATPGREDVQMIWRDLPPQNKQSQPDIRIRNKTTKKEYRYWLVRVPYLDGSSIAKIDLWYVQDAEWALKNNLGIRSGDKDFYRRAAASFYKDAALTLYEMSCRSVEAKQDDRFKDNFGKSGWSMEDLVSNLMAFYGHVEGLDRKAIIRECGGWPDPKTAADMSKKVYNELDDRDIIIDPFKPGFDQPSAKGKSFRDAYLYNKDLSASITKDNRSGWHKVPSFFRTIEPLDKFGDWEGSDILSWEGMQKLKETHDVIARNTAPQNYRMSQQLAHHTSTGRGRGRAPGPAGVDRMA